MSFKKLKRLVFFTGVCYKAFKSTSSRCRIQAGFEVEKYRFRAKKQTPGMDGVVPFIPSGLISSVESSYAVFPLSSCLCSRHNKLFPKCVGCDPNSRLEGNPKHKVPP